eukprot:1157557-Pelagomonas_calceolata.AAC.9
MEGTHGSFEPIVSTKCFCGQCTCSNLALISLGGEESFDILDCLNQDPFFSRVSFTCALNSNTCSVLHPQVAHHALWPRWQQQATACGGEGAMRDYNKPPSRQPEDNECSPRPPPPNRCEGLYALKVTRQPSVA